MNRVPTLDLHAATAAIRSGALWTKPKRSQTLVLFVLAGVVFVAFLSLVLSGRAAILVLDKPSQHFIYPFTIQNFMHIIFFVGLGDLFVRWRIASREKSFLALHYLPEDDQTVLVSQDLGPVRKRVAGQFDHENGFLPSLINIAVLQFQSSSSVEQATGVMNQHLELMSHRVDLRYGLVRFIAWLVPTLGFIGTVYSLGASLSAAGLTEALDLKQIARTLGIGFDCTMIALVEQHPVHELDLLRHPIYITGQNVVIQSEGKEAISVKSAGVAENSSQANPEPSGSSEQSHRKKSTRNHPSDEEVYQLKNDPPLSSLGFSARE